MIRNKMLFFSQLSHIFWTNITPSTSLILPKTDIMLTLLGPEHSNEKKTKTILPKTAAVKCKY